MGDRTTGISLIGMRRSGKSTVGRRLSEALSLPFTDLDSAIESREGEQVADILVEKGERFFRKIETEVLASVVDCGPAVLACGGGVPLLAGNRERLSDFGQTLYLHVPVEILEARMRADADPSTRPALLGVEPEEEIHQLMMERESLYRGCADAVIDASADVEGVVDRCLRALRLV